jgi:hypothetical protein
LSYLGRGEYDLIIESKLLNFKEEIMSQINATIDDNLLKQARQLTGMNSDNNLLEYALRIVIALQPIKQNKPQTAQRIGKASERLSPSSFYISNSLPAYQGNPLSIEDMQTAIDQMAEQHK